MFVIVNLFWVGVYFSVTYLLFGPYTLGLSWGWALGIAFTVRVFYLILRYAIKDRPYDGLSGPPYLEASFWADVASTDSSFFGDGSFGGGGAGGDWGCSGGDGGGCSSGCGGGCGGD